MRIPLAGGGQETLLTEVGAQYLLPLFSTAEACALRLVCREFLAAVTEQPWQDSETVIQGSIAAWRACFPRALCASVTQADWSPEWRSAPVVDADFVHFQGLRELDMSSCSEVTDAAFTHLRGIHTLHMSGCSLVTDAAFARLCGIHTLYMSECKQAGITDAAFAHLRGIHTLSLSGCNQKEITDAAFAHLSGIHALMMAGCDQAGITDAAFAHLRGIYSLDMSGCTQAGITDAAIVHLRGIDTLLMCDCSESITGATFSCLAGVSTLAVSDNALFEEALVQDLAVRLE